MPYQPIARYRILEDAPNSKYSRPRREHPDGSYEIHLVKASDPQYIPNDIEIWPIYHSRILGALQAFPEASAAAFKVYCEVQKEYQGKANQDGPLIVPFTPKHR